MRSWATQEWIARDLYHACIHEVGHAAVAAYLGVAGTVQIIRNPTGGKQHKHYVGRYTPLAEPTDREWPLIGLAGVAAECYESDPNVSGWDISDYIDTLTVELSATDAEHAGDFTVRDVERCLRVLRRYWPRIVAESRRLARPEVIREPPRRMDWTTFGIRVR